MKKIAYFGALMDHGASKRGVCLGPAAIRFAGLEEGLREMELETEDLGDIQALQTGKTLENMRHYEQVAAMNRAVYERALSVHEKGELPVLLGGDHSVATGSILATAQRYKNIGVVWVDAHGDWNNELTTPTGNMHGMSFSAACGYGPACMAEYGQAPLFVDPKKCVQIGGREIDKEEKKRMKEAGVHVFSIDKIDRFGIRAVMEEAIAIATDGTEGFHVSFDIDAVSPEYAPGTGTTVHSGLTAREAFTVAEMLADTGKVLAIDLVEVNPIHDEHNKTAALGAALIRSLLGERVF